MSGWRRMATQRGGNVSWFKTDSPLTEPRFVGLLWVALIGLVFPGFARAQSTDASIDFNRQTQVFRINAADMSYVMGINEKKQIQTLYWGKRLSVANPFVAAHSDSGVSSFDSPINTTPQEFAAWGGGLYVEPDLKVNFPDGNRDLVLQYVSHAIEGHRLTILLKDISRDVYVELHYQADAPTGILRRSAQVQNRTRAPLTIEQIASGTWNLPLETDYRLRYLTGPWAGEWNLHEQIIQPGTPILERPRESTEDQSSSWHAIQRNGSNYQERGDVWFGALGWSGSLQII